MVSVGTINNKARVCAHLRAYVYACMCAGLEIALGDSMCTRELYRVESRVHGRSEEAPDVWFIDGRSISDTLLKNPHLWRVDRIPCGKCMECRISKSKEWANRCVKEAKEYENNTMITLTYDDEHLPRSQGINPETGEVYESSTLVHKDVADFMKRLRKRYGAGIKYFMCGEYGSDKEYTDHYGNTRKGTERPHYHIILFNMEFEDMKFYKWSFCEWSPNIKNALYKSKILDKLWGKGHADINEVNYETCAYVARYTTKKYKGSYSDEYYKLKGQRPPYIVASQGIAKACFERNKEKFWNDEPVWAVSKKGLTRVKSRYFDKLMEKECEDRFEELKRERKAKSNKMWDNILDKTDIPKYEYIENSDSKAEMKYRFLKMRK